MRLKNTLLLFATLGLLSAALWGCGGEDEPGHQDDDPECPRGTYCPIEGSIHDVFVPEPFGIAMNWFDYTLKSHVVERVPAVYRGFFDGESTLFSFESYYDDRGESGKITMTGLDLGDESASVQTLKLKGNVKDDPVCVKLHGLKEVDCEGGEHDLIIRIEYRMVATAGFAVSNPSIYTTRHYIDFDEPGEVDIWRGEFDTVEDALAGLDDESKWYRMKDVELRPADGKIAPFLDELGPGEPSEAFVQGTSSMNVAGWWFEKSDDPYKIKLSANCVPTQLSSDEQALPLSADAKAQEFELAPDTVTLVNLCDEDGPALVEAQDEPYRGLWPAADTFDLFLDTFGERVEIFVNPGHFIWSSGQAEIDESVVIPEDFWEEAIWN